MTEVTQERLSNKEAVNHRNKNEKECRDNQCVKMI